MKANNFFKRDKGKQQEEDNETNQSKNSIGRSDVSEPTTHNDNDIVSVTNVENDTKCIKKSTEDESLVSSKREKLISALVSILSRSSGFRLITLQLTIVLVKELIHSQDSAPNITKSQDLEMSVNQKKANKL